MNRLISTAILAVLTSAVQAKTLTFVCKYPTYSSPDGLESVAEKFELTFILDNETDKAYILGNNGTEEVSMFSSDSGINLIEITGTGNLMTTTITKTGDTVHSRNGVILGDLIPSQYYGQCEIK